MKIIVVIPCFNEEKTLPLVINSIPKKIPGIDKVEIAVIDDGSLDKTAIVAKKLKVDYLISHKINKGLAKAFSAGLEAALKNGADIIVNTDGDNQYPQEDIPRLIKPILDGTAEIVIADRQVEKIPHFSKTKKFFQKFGSALVRIVSQTDIPDTVSGFRAYSKEAALQLNIMTDYSYSTETLIQAGKKMIPMTSIKIETNPKLRESRLSKNMWHYIKKIGSSTLRIYAIYEPLKTFFYLGTPFVFLGTFGFFRFVYFFFKGNGSGHLQSLVFSAVLVIVGFQIWALGILADITGINRKLLEDILLRLKKEKIDKEEN